MSTTRSRTARPRSGAAAAPFRAADRDTAQLAKALAHPARVAIVRMLLERGECICGAIVSGLPLSQATVSQHLKVLKRAGVVSGEVDGPRVCYCVDPRAVRRLQELLGALAPKSGGTP